MTNEAIANLEKVLDKLPAKDRLFACDMLNSVRKYNSCSEKQLYWIIELAKRADAPIKQAISVGSFEGVKALFARAQQNLRHPKINLAIGDQPIELSVAGPKSKAPGTINVTDGGPYGANIWFGRVTEAGSWEASNKSNSDAVVELLTELAADPAGVAGKYGRLSGRCCFCNRKLTDEQSTAAGFGRTCAKNFGLLDQWNEAVAVLNEG